MERFAFKIDKTLKANLYKICRLCGIDNPEKVPILGYTQEANNVDDSEPELWRKIQVCIGLIVSKDDKMPQTMCSLCVDKINDFFEFREMCFATNAQTRKLLGLKDEKQEDVSIELAKIKEITAKSKSRECIGKIKEDIDDKKPLATPVSLRKRTLFGKGKRKRKADDMGLRTTLKNEVDDIKCEKPTTSTTTSGMPLRKKSKLSSCTLSSVTSPTNATSDTITNKTSTISTTLNTSFSSVRKKIKSVTPLQRRGLEQGEKKLKPKDEIKEEDAEELDGKSKETKDAPLSVPPKVNVKFASKLKHLCNICDQRFINKTQLERHLYATHIPNVPRFFCTACNETMKKSNEIKNHQLWHKLSKTPFVCALCDECLLNSYAYSRHLREHIPEVPTTMLVLDRQCPQCQETFATTFLYNIHSCSLKTKKCAGCNRYLKNDAEYLKHASVCPKMFVNYSKHISAAAVAAESNVRIKNENDVEAAAAAEALTRIGNPVVNMAPVVSLTRLSTPLLMQSNQCVLIPGQNIEMSEELPMSPTTLNSKTPKKSNKKGVSRKELKRVDELLKSTMDTLVSIKHEPEVHMGTCEVVPEQPAAEKDEISPGEEDTQMDDLPSYPASPRIEDDFQNDSTHSEGDSHNDTMGGISIKQELVDVVHKATIKQEMADEETATNKIPVLKLKITKEHGKLNSSIVQQNDSIRSEKKKKKKRRKDIEKDKERMESVSVEKREELDLSLPQLGIVSIKQERSEGCNFPDTIQQHSPNQEQMTIPSLVMTTIPQPLEFRISSISSGVDFNIGVINYGEKETVANAMETNTTEVQLCAESCDDELQDIKPCRESLDRLLQITDVSGGVGMVEKQGQVGDHQENVTLHHNVEVSERHKKLKTERSPHKSKKAHRKAMQHATSGVHADNAANYSSVPQIIAVSSGNDASNTFYSAQSELSHVEIKKERFDDDYGDPTLQSNIDGSQKHVDAIENSLISIKHTSKRKCSSSSISKQLVQLQKDSIEPGSQKHRVEDIDSTTEISLKRHTTECWSSGEVSVKESDRDIPHEDNLGKHFSAENASICEPEDEQRRKTANENAYEQVSGDIEQGDDFRHDTHDESEDENEDNSPNRGLGILPVLNPEPLENLNTFQSDLTETNSLQSSACRNQHKLCEEQAYIANIDFNNIVIKQEKDIEVSEFELNESVFSNGFIPKQKESTQLSKFGIQQVRKAEIDRNIDVDNDELDEEEGEEEEDEAEEEEEEEEDDDDDDDDDDDESDTNEENENCLEEREYRELELPPMMLENVNAASSTLSKLNIESSLNEEQQQQHYFVNNTAVPQERERRCPMMMISNVVSNATELAQSPARSVKEPEMAEIDKKPDVEVEPVEAIVTQEPQFRILSVVSESAGSVEQQKENSSFLEHENANNSVAVTEPHSLYGLTTHDVECDSKATPFFDPIQPPQEPEFPSETVLIQYQNDNNEENQNRLNHETLNSSTLTITHNLQENTTLENVNTMSRLLEPEDEASTGTTSPNFRTDISSLSNIATPSSSSQLLLSPPKFNEEIENQINESNDASNRSYTNTAIPQHPIMIQNNNPNFLLEDDSNINEIAENNNNANIERELQDDSQGTNESISPNDRTR